MSRKPPSMHIIDGSNKMITNVINLDSDSELDFEPEDQRRMSSPSGSTPYSVGVDADNQFSDDDVLVLEPEEVQALKRKEHTRWHNPVTNTRLLADPPPWLRSNAPAQTNLAQEIKMFLSHSSPLSQENVLRARLVTRLTDIIQSMWSDSSIEVFGSYETDLHLPVSDLDIVVFNTHEGKNALFKLAKALRRQGFLNIQVISRARVPIIKFSDPSSIDVDICFDQTSGLSSSAFVKSAIAEWPALKPLVMVLKYFLRLRGLNEPFTGGIGSYALVLMVLSFLQMCDVYKRPSSPDAPDTNDLGQLLFEFFQLYGHKFNYITTGVCVRAGGSYFPKARRGWFDSDCPARLSIEDPQNPDNDVGKSSYKMLEVQMAFAAASDVIARAKPKATQSLLQIVFGSGHNLIAEHREKRNIVPVEIDTGDETEVSEHRHHHHHHHHQRHHHNHHSEQKHGEGKKRNHGDQADAKHFKNKRRK